mgnify:CR=1 FL=1
MAATSRHIIEPRLQEALKMKDFVIPPYSEELINGNPDMKNALSKFPIHVQNVACDDERVHVINQFFKAELNKHYLLRKDGLNDPKFSYLQDIELEIEAKIG